MGLVDIAKSGIATLGYNLGLGGYGVTEPLGTQYNQNQTPYSVYNATQGYTNSIPQSYNATTSPMGYQPIANYGSTPVGSAQTSVNSAPRTTASTGTPTGQVLGTQAPANNTPQGPDYSGYYSQIDQILNGLNDQRSAQEGIVQNSYNSGANQLNSQLQTGNSVLQTNQAKSLNDIGSSIANGFRAGNLLLGSMGAGDSSAANQYAYALAKEGSKQRGSVMNDYSSKQQQLKQTYDSGINQLETQRQNGLLQVASWFVDAQNSLRGQKADVAKQQSEAVYNYALSQLQRVQQRADVQRSNLETWALNVSKDTSSLQSNLQAIGQYQAPYQQQNYTPTAGNTAALSYFGGQGSQDSTQQNSLFRNSVY